MSEKGVLFELTNAFLLSWLEFSLQYPHPPEASPPAPLRMERGVITEVTPIG